MKVSLFDYELPEGAIAQEPTPDRGQSRLLVLSRADGSLQHRVFCDLPQLLQPGDALVLNNTQVIPARLFGHKRGGRARIEMLLLEDLGEQRWKVLAQRARRLRPGAEIDIDSHVTATVEEELGDGQFAVRFTLHGNWMELLSRVGRVPLPPYIRRPAGRDHARDRERYQTVFARVPGSAAAPTAGLHFSPEILSALTRRGVRLVEITLHVGLDTFRPVLTEEMEDHVIHSERYEVSEEAVAALSETRAAGGRIVAVGTTTTRALETVVDEEGVFHPSAGRTRLYILPGRRFCGVDAMLTNFHLPRTTLLAMVAAFAGRERVLAAYRAAIAAGYRFYSYGDAMLIV
ncbi:tRNA preQ1(34) S-adenosylmethionine ribosyltransferase-isomerase QueA [bacterium]|nr:tRNA preQ1(34) S-adenosylmethionine ribosyltransferase-isomerase QueA [bacterium]